MDQIRNPIQVHESTSYSLTSTNSDPTSNNDPQARLLAANHNPTVVPWDQPDIKVMCRVCPMKQRELDLGSLVCVEFHDDFTIALKPPLQDEGVPKSHTFTFDRVFDMTSSQEEIYNTGVQQTVESVFDGINCGILAYGQTYSGKTYTLQGETGDHELKAIFLKGIIPRAADTIFEKMKKYPQHIEFTTTVSIVEIYLEKIRDLLNLDGRDLKIKMNREEGVYIKGMTETPVTSTEQVNELLRQANQNHTIPSTVASRCSLRLTLVFTLNIYQKNILESSVKTGKLYVVKLPGSERIPKTIASPQVVQETKYVGVCLSALGNVIYALSSENKHIPYRDSKLTYILKDLFERNSNITMIVGCSPSSSNYDETLSTLRFGSRVKSLRNRERTRNLETQTRIENEKRNEEKKVDEEVKLPEKDNSSDKSANIKEGNEKSTSDVDRKDGKINQSEETLVICNQEEKKV